MSNKLFTHYFTNNLTAIRLQQILNKQQFVAKIEIVDGFSKLSAFVDDATLKILTERFDRIPPHQGVGLV